MKRYWLHLPFFLALFAFHSSVNSQVFNGDKELLSQADVDAFNFTSVTGKLTLFGTSISNLNGLSELQSVGGVFEISTTAITNLDPLSNLQSVGGLFIRGNSVLANLNGFSSLTSAAGALLRFQNNRALSDFDGLLSLTGVIAGIAISDCPITDLHGFSNISDITGFIELESNPNLTNLGGLSVIAGLDVVHSIKLIDNSVLQNIDELSAITSAGDITITGNSILPNLDGLSNLTAVVNMIIGHNPALTNIDGLSNVQTMLGSLWIRSNSELTNINGLSSLTSVGKELLIDVNSAMTNIDGLINLTSIGTNLIIANNFNLINLDGLQNLTTVGNDLKINSNFHLVDFCGLFKLFDQGTIGGSIIEIKDNGANTVTIPPTNIIVFADQGLCTAVVSDATIGSPVNGCLGPINATHSSFPPGNIFPVDTTSITWSATDAANNKATGIQNIIVVDNQVPTITCPGPTTVSCASDVPPVDVNSVTASDNCSAVVTHSRDDTTNKTCANRFILTRIYRATDPTGNFAECSQVITVHDDVPPQISGLAASQSTLWPPNHTMRDITLSYSATDNCLTDLDISVSVTSNEAVNGTADGDTDPDWEIIDDHHIRLRAERAANGTGRIYTITVTVSDGCNSSVSASTQVECVHNITAPVTGKPFRVGSMVGLAGEFWDKPTNEHTAKWLIDGTTVKGIVTEPTATKNGKVTGSYKFTNPGVYRLQMNITDQSGITSYVNTNADLEEIIVIYDPSGDYTYGGGYFASSAGALKSNPVARGDVSYGFTVNYYKGATLPKGETQFEFKVGNFEYTAVNFDYLSILGAKAQFKGTGKIVGGQSGVNFMMTVIDGDLDGSGVDKVRIKIYNKNTGQIYYDNQSGASDAANPTTAVGLNSSVVIQNTTINTVTQKAIANAEMMDLATGLEAKVNPNPSYNNFTLTIRSNNPKDKITMRVIDIYGRTIELRNVAAEQTIKLGDRYRPGNYTLQFIQGENHRQLKLVKLSD